MGFFDRFRKRHVEPIPWMTRATAWVDRQVADGFPFSADDLREEVGNPENPKQIGALLSAYRRRGQIIQVDSEPSRRPERKGGKIAVFNSPAFPYHFGSFAVR